MLKPLATWLAAQAGLTVGTTLFAGTRPATAPHLCTTLLERGVERVSELSPELREKAVQILTRGPVNDYFAGKDEADRVFDLVINQYGLTAVEGWTIHSVLGDAPQYIGQDDKGRHEFSANVVVRARKAGG